MSWVSEQFWNACHQAYRISAHYGIMAVEIMATVTEYACYLQGYTFLRKGNIFKMNGVCIKCKLQNQSNHSNCISVLYVNILKCSSCCYWNFGQYYGNLIYHHHWSGRLHKAPLLISAGTSAAILPNRLKYFRAIEQFQTQILATLILKQIVPYRALKHPTQSYTLSKSGQ